MDIMRALILAVVCSWGLVATTGARADDLAKLNGSWEGILKVNPAVELRLVWRVDAKAGAEPKLFLDSPDQGANGIKVDTATLDKDAVTFEAKAIAGTFSGKLNKDATEIAGEWKQGGMTYPLTFKKTDGKEVVPEIWEGTLELPGGQKLRIIFRLTLGKDGAVTRATLDSPDQNTTGIKVDEASKKDGSLNLVAKSIMGEYSGKLNKDETEATGDWKQGGGTFPLTLKKVSKPSATAPPNRPQEPKPPFPYEVEEVSYENPNAPGVKLAGTFTKPKGNGPFPAVLLITGSGPQDRDEALMGHRPFFVLADALTRRGIAVLRCDDRGVGKSTGEFAKATSEDFASDALAGVAFLKGRKDVNSKAIGLIGHSEGGIVAPMAASQSPDVAYIVLMAGTGLTGAEILAMQSGLILKATGVSDDRVNLQVDTIRKLTQVIRDEPDNEKALATMKDLTLKTIEALPEEERKTITSATLEAQVKTFTTPWFRYFLTYDPRPTLKKVKCPVLAINGEKDLQVPPKENLAEIAKALKEGGNTKVTVREFPGLNHLFQACKTGAPSEYGGIEETINPAALDTMATWVLEQAK
jgi:pimeloyl-ACP methyl ester carboxylesterase